MDYQKLLSDKGIRPSAQRVVICQYVYEHHTHPTVDTVYTALSPLYPSLSRTTVYNTLKLFTQNKIVTAIKIENDELRYDSCTEPHLHFKCTQCGNVFDIFCKDKLSSFYSDCTGILPEGFSLNSIQTNIWGLCADCQKHANI